MKLLSVNIGQEQTLVRPNKSEQTGIFKQPVAGPVRINSLGLEGDFIGDSKNHGGPDQAVYIYTQPDYDWWSQELGKPTFSGQFGENLTISDIKSAEMNIGDIFKMGSVVLQVTAPRIPCGTLAGKMEIPPFAKQFRFGERPGLYCRVLQEGLVQAGDEIIFEKYARETVSILESMRGHYEPILEEENIRKYLRSPIAIRMREDKDEQLAKLLNTTS